MTSVCERTGVGGCRIPRTLEPGPVLNPLPVQRDSPETSTRSVPGPVPTLVRTQETEGRGDTDTVGGTVPEKAGARGGPGDRAIFVRPQKEGRRETPPVRRAASGRG